MIKILTYILAIALIGFTTYQIVMLVKAIINKIKEKKLEKGDKN